MVFLNCQFCILTSDASQRIFMYKVGGGYIFIHRLVIEHLANMKLD